MISELQAFCSLDKALCCADDDNEGFLSRLRLTQKELGSLLDGENVKECCLNARQLQGSRYLSKRSLQSHLHVIELG